MTPYPPTALQQLLQLFPNADPGFLRSAIEHHSHQQQVSSSRPGRKGSGEDDEQLLLVVRKVAEKCAEMGEDLPVVVWRREARTRTRTQGDEYGSLRSRRRERSEERREADWVTIRNLALVKLHAMFPFHAITSLLAAVHLNRVHDQEEGPMLLGAVDFLLANPVAPSDSQLGTKSFWTNIKAVFASGTAAGKDQDPTDAEPPPRLLPCHLLRSKSYHVYLFDHLLSRYPSFSPREMRTFLSAMTTVRSSTPLSYGELRELLDQRERARRAGWRGFFFGGLLGASERGDRREMKWEEKGCQESDEDVEELRREIERFERRKSGLSDEEDDSSEGEYPEADADEQQQAQEHEQECQCCFTPLPSHSLVPCLAPSSSSSPAASTAAPRHQFCSACLTSLLTSTLFGSLPLHLSPSAPLGLHCPSTEGCSASFAPRDLRRAVGRKLFDQLEKRVEEVNLTAALDGRRIVRCPAEGCGYAEEREQRGGLRGCFPLWAEEVTGLDDGLEKLLTSLWSVVVLNLLWSLVWCAVCWDPEAFADHLQPTRSRAGRPSMPVFPILEPLVTLSLIQHYITQQATLVQRRKAGSTASLLRCRRTPNSQPLPLLFGEGVERCTSSTTIRSLVWPTLSCSSPAEKWCGRISCIECRAEVLPARGKHVCYESEREGLRLAVERARSEAVKRTCGRCGLGFVKEGGCNKMVCRCGAVQCYVCRAEIGEREGYGHYCQHFRDTPGPCTQCHKCSLWLAPNDDQAAAKAAKDARQRWLEEKYVSSDLRMEQDGWEEGDMMHQLQRTTEILLCWIIK